MNCVKGILGEEKADLNYEKKSGKIKTDNKIENMVR